MRGSPSCAAGSADWNQIGPGGPGPGAGRGGGRRLQRLRAVSSLALGCPAGLWPHRACAPLSAGARPHATASGCPGYGWHRPCVEVATLCPPVPTPLRQPPAPPCARARTRGVTAVPPVPSTPRAGGLGVGGIRGAGMGFARCQGGQPGPWCRRADGVKPFCLEQELRAAARCQQPGASTVPWGRGQGQGWCCLRWGQMAGRPCQTAGGRILHSAPSGQSRGHKALGATDTRRGIVWGWAALQWGFVRLSGPSPGRSSAGVMALPLPRCTQPHALLAVPGEGVELLGPPGGAGRGGGRAGDDGAGAAGLATGERSAGPPLSWGCVGPDPDTRFLQREHGWTVSKLLHDTTMLYDAKDDAETQARQRAQK